MGHHDRRRWTLPEHKGAVLASAGLDVRLFERLAAVWRLTDDERSAVLALSPEQYTGWLTGSVNSEVAHAVGVRLGHLLAIDLAAQANYGPGTELAADAVRRRGTAPDGVAAAFPLLAGDVATLIALRRVFEHRAGGIHILAIAPTIMGMDGNA